MAIKFKNFDEEAEKRAKEIGAVKKNTATSSNTIAGVDSSTIDKAYKSTFKESDDVKNAMSESGTALGKVKDLTSKGQLVSDDTWNSLGKQFSKPNAVSQADSYLSSQLQKIQSGKTSYSDQVRDMMDTIMGREKFTYDVDKDPLFQQALASAINSGKTAMQDTIGQASALTGGYGSSYATSAGNQAYNAFIEDAYNNLPQYYQMAMEAYQMEGDDLYRQLDMLVGADEREYSRNVTAYDATYQHRNQMYNEAYQQFRDAKNDAYNIANLKLSEHGQLVNDAYNYFNASADYANTLYEREYNKWADEVNQAMMWAQMLNSDWWKRTEFDEGVRQYEQTFAEDKRKFDATYKQNDEHFYKGLEHESSEKALDRAHDTTLQDDAQEHDLTVQANEHSFKSGENALDRAHDVTMQDDAQAWSDSNREDNQKHDVTMQDDAQAFTSSENAKYKTSGGGSGSGSGSGGDDEYSTLTNTEYNAITKIYTEAGGGDKGIKAVDSYLETIGKNNLSTEATEALKANLDGISVPIENQGWTLTTDTKNGGFLWWKGDDHDDVYTDVNGNKLTYDKLVEKINNSDLSDDEKKELKKYYKNQSNK